MPYIVTATANKGRKNKAAYSLRIVVPKPLLEELGLNETSLFFVNLAIEQDREIEPYYQDYGYDFGLECYIGTNEYYRKLARDRQPKPLTKFGKSSLGFAIRNTFVNGTQSVLHLQAGTKLACDIVSIEPSLYCDTRAILYKVIS